MIILQYFLKKYESRKKSTTLLTSLPIVILSLSPSPLLANLKTTEPAWFAAPDSSISPVKKISSTEYQIGSVVMNSERREIYIEGRVNMKKGMIELLACGRAGKLHESVLVLDLVPHDLHVALLLLGLEPRGNLKYQGDPAVPQGDSVELFVEWKENGIKKVVRGEDMVYDLTRKKPMEHTPWIFTGSRVLNGTYRADIEQSIITTYHDPMTILDNPLLEGGDDTVYQVNEALVPPKGTPIHLTIRALSAPKIK